MVAALVALVRRPLYLAGGVAPQDQGSPADARAVCLVAREYPPIVMSGVAVTLHAISRFLVERLGMDVCVAVPRPLVAVPALDGVRVVALADGPELSRALGRAATWVSHDDLLLTICSVAARIPPGRGPRSVVAFVDDTADQLRRLTRRLGTIVRQCAASVQGGGRRFGALFNSEWVAKTYQLAAPTFVLHPPVFVDQYATPDGRRRFVTLVGLDFNKGGLLLVFLARRMPDVEFLGVAGAHGLQIRDRSLRNVTYRETTRDVRDVYAQTRVLLVPSLRETWGRVAVEAMSSGIPVVARANQGLLESCRDAAVFVATRSAAKWEAALRRVLDDGALYEDLRQRSRRRAAELDAAKELASFGAWFQKTSL